MSVSSIETTTTEHDDDLDDFQLPDLSVNLLSIVHYEIDFWTPVYVTTYIVVPSQLLQVNKGVNGLMFIASSFS